MNLIIKGLLYPFFVFFSAYALPFGCSVDNGYDIESGNYNIYVQLEAEVQPYQNLIVDLSRHLKCWNSYGGWQDVDHINLEPGTGLSGPLFNFSGSVYWYGNTYSLPLNSATKVLHIGDLTPMPMPMMLYLTPINNSPAGGVLIRSGETIATINMYKIADWDGGNPKYFTWEIVSKYDVTMPISGCDVSSRNVNVNLPPYPGEAPVNLNIHCAQPQNISFYLSGQTTNDDTTFINLAGSAGEVSKGMGVQLMRNGYVIPANKAISLGRVNSSTSLGLKARYGMTGERVTAGKVKSIIGVNFIYE